jgi:hypothetical protein
MICDADIQGRQAFDPPALEQFSMKKVDDRIETDNQSPSHGTRIRFQTIAIEEYKCHYKGLDRVWTHKEVEGNELSVVQA